MHKMALLWVILCTASGAYAQVNRVSGRVMDSVLGRGLAYATVSLVEARDSTLVTFAVADSTGHFVLNNAGKGPYLLSASYAGYAPVWRPLSPGDQIFYLTNLSRLKDITLATRRPPVEINNDTLEFNTENFKTQPNAVVEDLLRKMPGVTIESDGTVKVNGQTVRRVLVNGKEFFKGDIKMATKNLNADAVDKVQVFDRKTDQAVFTGIDDGNSEKTINLKLKKDRNNALFGKIGGGAGDEGRYDAQANINRFSGDRQLSFLGMGNNTNRQGFSLTDVLNFTGELSHGMRNGGGGIHIQTTNDGNSGGTGLPVTGLGQSQQGVASTLAGGLNYNNAWNKGATTLNTNYTASHVRLETDESSYLQNLLPGDAYDSRDTAHTINEVTQHRFNLILDHQVDSALSVRLTPSLTWQNNHKDGADTYNSVNTDGQPLNIGYNNTGTATNAFNATTNLLVRKRLPKKGRTLSASLDLAYNHSTLAGTQVSGNTLYAVGQPPLDSNINQSSARNALTRSLGGNITYTEPLGKRSLLALSGFYNVNTGQSDKQTYNYDAVSGKHDELDSVLSNDFTSRYAYSGGTLSFRTNRQRANITLEATLQTAGLSAIDNSSGRDVRQSFTDVLPNALLQYRFSQTKNLRIDYTTYTTQPSVTQLQPVADLSNPLAVTIGNPSLERSYTQNVSANFISASPARRRSLFAFLTLSATTHATVQSDSVTTYGTKTTRPVNADGVGTVLGQLDYGWPLRKLFAQVDLGSSLGYDQNVSFINGARNHISSLSAGPRLSYAYNPGKHLSLTLSANLSLNTARYSLESALNTTYLSQNYGVDLIDDLPMGISLHNVFNYILNTGRTGGYNTDIPLWNTTLSKYLLKHDRGELSLSVMDVLDRNTGITRSINQGDVLDERYNVLQRYFIIAFTYSLNKSGLKSSTGANIRLRTFGR